MSTYPMGPFERVQEPLAHYFCPWCGTQVDEDDVEDIEPGCTAIPCTSCRLVSLIEARSDLP